MKLSREEVQHIADLARLALSDDQVATYQEQLSAILEHFEHLQQLETEEIPPTASVLPLRSVMREDVVQSSLQRDRVLVNAPDATGGCFRVPPVLE
jgi:aspartyl-tRNA(Asn)/glutamyl-tRNA(Gln) amidotransferase subunit C